ncbi:hypothetical protein NLJ89_g7714 [Agrocybe chaxingu]|uniref:Uncharacterized protein n=1 Tax=Agrocybe chaxingu TaxID=84603 RepID=A0A9W8MV68_9AGAR|nr:hypothetical protein NLJ89_g7714 [Agrocybe chaxingu]
MVTTAMSGAPLPPPPPSNPSSAPSSTRTSMLGSHFNIMSSRKEMPITPSTKMKQLQWDKLAQQQVGNTVWKEDAPEKEQAMLKKLQLDGVWLQMEEDFKAKQLVINLMAKQKRAELRSILDPETKKRVEIIIQRHRHLQPEELAQKIQQFDPKICTEVFLSSLKPDLPSPEQIGKLNVYRNADTEELAGLHPSDRLMVQLIKIDRLGPRIEGMLYKVTFDERWALLDEGARKLSDAGKDILDAQNFKQLLSLILLIGNYMNGTGIKGGAFGFRVSSINKLVDTKSVNNTTLLHFLERTVAKHFPEMEQFLDELEVPAEGYRVNLQDVRRGLSDLRDGLARIRQELVEHFADVDQNDLFQKQMWTFYNRASVQLEDLVDDVRNADTTFVDAIAYYGEDDKNMTSSEFYGIFKTFITSYKKCKVENQTAAEERLALERRKQALQEHKAHRQKEAIAEKTEDEGALERILDNLRNGDPIRSRRRRTADKPRPTSTFVHDSANAIADTSSFNAQLMLARLQSDGFVAPPSPTVPTQRRRRRMEKLSDSDRDGPTSPLVSEIVEVNEDEMSETADDSSQTLRPETP